MGLKKVGAKNIQKKLTKKVGVKNNTSKKLKKIVVKKSGGNINVRQCPIFVKTSSGERYIATNDLYLFLKMMPLSSCLA